MLIVKDILILFIFLLIVGCKSPAMPTLPEMQAETHVQTAYTKALDDLNLILEVYLPPDFPDTYYFVKPIRDVTGTSSTGEIPTSITTLVRDALSQIYYKVRYVEQYDTSDLTHQQTLNMMQQTNKLLAIGTAVRPQADYTIGGAISQFDRNLESTSHDANAMANFGRGLSRTDISASASAASRLSRIGVSFNITDSGGVSVPGKYGATMEVSYGKNSADFGFSIFGNGLGYAAEAVAMHGRHLALQMMCELSVVQIVGHTLSIPYWRIGKVNDIYAEDRLVINQWRNEYSQRESSGLLIPYIQAQLIACGDGTVVVTGHLDGQTKEALDRFSEKHGIRNRVYPNFEVVKALELNRLLDRETASMAWSAYNAYKGGARPSSPAASAPTSRPSPSASPAATPARKPKAAPARPAAPAPDVTSPLEDLL